MGPGQRQPATDCGGDGAAAGGGRGLRQRLSHLGEAGRARPGRLASGARMVDVGAKRPSRRRALAEGEIVMSRAAFAAVQENRVAKGDALRIAEVAGAMAAKRTAELIPLCHPLPLDHIAVAATPDATLPGVRVRAEVRTEAKTGVEMEALTACAVALLTVYDMVKSADRRMRIGAVRLIEKSGGDSGRWREPD